MQVLFHKYVGRWQMAPLGLTQVANNRNTGLWKFWTYKSLFTGSQKAYCVWYNLRKVNLFVTAQRQFFTKYGLQQPTNKTINTWFWKFKESGSLCDEKWIDHPDLSTKRVIRILDVFVRSWRKSIRQASAELQILRKVFVISCKRICK